jgi:hypothetical protein
LKEVSGKAFRVSLSDFEILQTAWRNLHAENVEHYAAFGFLLLRGTSHPSQTSPTRIYIQYALFNIQG